MEEEKRLSDEEIKKIEERSKIQAEGVMTLEECYDKIKKTILEYIDIDPKYLDVICTWIIGTYLHDQFYTYPYIYINATKQSGKTRLLKLISYLAYKGKLCVDMTEAVLFREAHNKTTFCIDELENITSKEKTALRLLLNSAYKKGMKVMRMQEKRLKTGRTQVKEEFNMYTPIAMANIWGLDDVLQDRCITIRLEKSTKREIIGKMEIWELDTELEKVKDSLMYTFCEGLRNVVSVVSVDVVTGGITTFPIIWNIIIGERNDINDTKDTKEHNDTNDYNILKKRNDTNDTATTFYLSPGVLEEIEEKKGIHLSTELYKLCEKLWNFGVFGRNLELFYPLIMIFYIIKPNEIDEFLKNIKQIVEEKEEEEKTENRDNCLISFLFSFREREEWMSLRDITQQFKAEEEEDWINSKWVGRALKRLNLIEEKVRSSAGRQIKINWKKVDEKAKQIGLTKEEVG